MRPAAGRRLSPADALWLDLDRPDNLMVIVAVVLLRERPDWDAVLDVAHCGRSTSSTGTAAAPLSSSASTTPSPTASP